jgi:hypothetical protein
MDVMPLILLVLFMLLPIAFWIYQFVELMRLDDNSFSGRYDKMIWGAAFILLFPLAPIAFLYWKHR